MDRHPTQIILSPAGMNSSRRYSKSKNPTTPALIARPKGTTKKASGSSGVDGGGGAKGEDLQIGERLKAIQERRERLQAKIDLGRLPPIPPSKNASAGSQKTLDANSLSPNWKAKDSRQSKIGTPPQISISQPENHKIKIPIVRLSPLPPRTQSELPRRSTPRKDVGHHDPLPVIKNPHPEASHPPEEAATEQHAPPNSKHAPKDSNPQPSTNNEERHPPSNPPKTPEHYPQDQLEMQLEMQRQMQALMQQQMRKMQQYFREQQEQQRMQQQQEKEQLMQQLREQQEQLEKHQKMQEENETADTATESNEDGKEEKEAEGGKEDEKDPKNEGGSGGKEGEKFDDEDDIGGLADDIVTGMQHTDRRIQVNNAIKARQLLSNDKPPVKQLIKAGILPVLVKCMGRHDIPDLQLEATWSVTNIASGASDHTWALVEAGAIPPLVDLVKNGKQNVKEQAVWAIGNIIGDGPDCRDEAVKNGVIQPLVHLLSPAMPITLRRQVCWVLTNLFRAKNPDISVEDRKLCANALRQLVSHYDAQIQVDSLWATAYFADLGSEGIDDLIQCGIVRELVQRLYSNDERVVAAALRATGTIAAGNHDQTDAIVEAGALPIYRELLKHRTLGIARETAWILSNITAGTPKQIQLVIDVQVVPALMAAADKDDPELRKEATWALSNLTSGGTPTQISILVQLGMLACLCGVLADDESGLMVVALEAINNIFQKTEDDSQIVRCVEGVGGLKTLRNLQEHDQGEVAKLAKYLIDTYFEGPGD
ncbi:importin subunit alpha-3-like isoform X2 [Macrobrachium rosenbergii]|uniref:importin subunit alpha-3-like isoform X2 n=1 Tax=Macrobrachium rosenbergii TaxID=79674 RepID=UPI0034D413A9